MTTKHKKIFAFTSMISVIVMAVAVLFTGDKLSVFKAPFVKATGSEYSVTFTRENAYSEDESDVNNVFYSYKGQTPNGNDIYLITKGGNKRVNNALGTIATSGSTSVSDMMLKFCKDAEGTIEFRHQIITSITIKTSGTVNLKIQTGADGYSYLDKTVLSCTSSGSTFSSFNEYDRYIAIKENARETYSSKSVKEVTITYQCENSTDPTYAQYYRTTVKDKNNLDTTLTIAFYSADYVGYYKFHSNTDKKDYTTLFTWEYNSDRCAIKVMFNSNPGGSVSGETASGGSDNYEGYCLFARNSSTYHIYNYVSVFDEKISIIFHSKLSTGTTGITIPDLYPNYNQRTSATVLTVFTPNS